jgi:acetyl-CoA acyltransferase
MGGNIPRPHPEYARKHAELYVSMGITAENVAAKYGISREDQDAFSYQSHMKATEAAKNNRFAELMPTPAARYVQTARGTFIKETVWIDQDDGIRTDTTFEKLAGLNPVFAAGGTVTAGNASQTTDGAAATVLMSEEKMKELGVRPIAKFAYYTTVGCRPEEMGVGPRYAIPILLERAGLHIDDIGLFEINEAFASQILYCLRELNLDKQMDKINVHGGAIALGHPLGCTGAKLCATLLNAMQSRGVKYGVESMCIGGGMGAAALFELCD